jgi:RNA polymerase sigma-70 factor (ECF subfamily)
VSDEALVERARRGDAAAFGELASAHRETIRRFLATLSSEDAEDLTQETLANAFATIDRFEGRSRFSTWLSGIALNLARQAYRAKRRRPAREDGPLDTAAARRGILTSLCRRELVERLDQAIDRLPVPLKEAFALRHVSELEYDEIAATLGVTEATARVRAHRARALLKSELGDDLDSIRLKKDPL